MEDPNRCGSGAVVKLQQLKVTRAVEEAKIRRLMALDHRTLAEQLPEQHGWKPDVVPGAFADWQLSHAIAPSSGRHCDEQT
jgi:hypothetical protein